MTSATMGEIVHPDGRHELTPEADAALGESRLHNLDLAPVPTSRRTWTTYNYLALWVGMSINVPSWLLASGLIAIGMTWWQAIITIGLGNLIVLVPMLLISHAGTKYGLPYPVIARASFGVWGANLPALLRAGVACGWFGIQTWIGGGALFAVVSALLGDGSWWATADKFAILVGPAQPWTLWLSFVIFWVLNILIILRGMDAIKRFENWAAPALIAVFAVLMVWMFVRAGDLGPVVSQPEHFAEGKTFLSVFPLSLMGMIAFWSTLSLNMPDFTRFGRSQREQAWGQALGLPTTMTLFPLVGVLTTSATAVVFGTEIWDPVALAAKLGTDLGGVIGGVLLLVMLITLAVATLSTNVAANVVSPSYDFSNAWPKVISFRTGGLITGVIGILIMPWNLLSTPELYIFTWLGFYGGLTGAIAGVIIADYWFIRRTKLRLNDLYQASGIYRYMSGWNWRAVVSLVVGAFIALAGAYSTPNADGSASGPFPADGIIPALKGVYDYSWLAALIIGFVLYWLLAKFVPGNDYQEM